MIEVQFTAFIEPSDDPEGYDRITVEMGEWAVNRIEKRNVYVEERFGRWHYTREAMGRAVRELLQKWNP
jgi:hypothetical protein